MAQFNAEAFADRHGGSVMDGILRQMELAALSSGATEDSLSRRLQTRMIIGDYIAHPAHATVLLDFPGKSGGTFDILTVSGGPNEPTKTTYLYR